jgi:dihydrofolate reductase
MKISIYIAISADGFISNSRNNPDWLSSEYEQGFASICRERKAVIMGKTTYNILAPDYLPLQKEGTTVVMTTDTQAKSNNPTVVFTKDKAPEIAAMLAKKGHTEAVIIGGAMAIGEFISARMVDDI